jgi:hypothetical protein
MKLKILLILCFLALGSSSVSAQKERFVRPVDEAKKDASFYAFRALLIEAAKRRDAKHVLSIVAPDIKNSFGEDGGIEEFKKEWKLESAESPFWDEFLPVITNGGQFVEAGKNKLFFAPYSFTSFPEDLDAFTYGVIFGQNVNLRAAPDLKAEVRGQLSYNVVEILNPAEDEENPEKASWHEVKTLGGKRGFVSARYVRRPVDYRAGFQKIGGKWKMTVFIAGD